MQVWLQLGEAFARVSVGAILNSLWEALALALLAWLVLRLVPRANASLRYGLWCLALVGVLVLPVIALHIGSLAPAAAAPSADPAVAVPQRFAQILFGLWYVVATVLVLRLIISYIRLQELKANARPLPLLYQHRVRRWLETSGGRRQCRLCVSAEVPMPVAIGLLDPVIVLPERLLQQLTDDELDQVGLHELAHLQRWDDYTNVFQRIAEALLFFNPAVYLIGRQLTLEREIACDDRVIAATGKPLTYAACLTRLVEATALARQALPALAALSTRRQFAIRIERLLDTKRNAFPVLSGLAGIAACLVIGGALAVASHVRPLVAVMPDSLGAGSTNALAVRVTRDPSVIALFLQSRHTVADAAVTAAAFPATSARRVSAAVHRVTSVARSNAVGARNFIVIRRTEHGTAPMRTLNYDIVEIIHAPAPNRPHAQTDAARPTIAYLDPIPAAISGRLEVSFKKLKGLMDRSPYWKRGLPKLRNHWRHPVDDPHVWAQYAATSAGYATDSNAYAEVSREFAAASAAYAKELHQTSTSMAPAAASASVALTDNVPDLVKLHALQPVARVDVIGQLAEHPDSAAARQTLADAMLHDASLTVKLRAVQALAENVNQGEQQAALIQALRASDSIRVKVAIVSALADALPDASVLRGLGNAFNSAQPEVVQLAAVEALTSAADSPEGQAVLVAAFNNATTARVKTTIIKALMDNVREPVVRRALQAALRSDQPLSVQLAAVEALAPAVDDPQIRAVLEQAGGSGCDIVRLSIKRALAQLATP